MIRKITLRLVCLAILLLIPTIYGCEKKEIYIGVFQGPATISKTVSEMYPFSVKIEVSETEFRARCFTDSTDKYTMSLVSYVLYNDRKSGQKMAVEIRSDRQPLDTSSELLMAEDQSIEYVHVFAFFDQTMVNYNLYFSPKKFTLDDKRRWEEEINALLGICLEDLYGI